MKSFKLHEIVSNGRQKLEQWQKDCHEKIDHFFEKKYQELDRLVSKKLDQQQEKILYVQSKMSKLVREQEAIRDDIDTLTSIIHQLETEIKKLNKHISRSALDR
ncbi:unnamed protein product [Rotaria sp. Silwood2]|nr:unnamed protein product [Rotaria sp. Silwood2]CAF3072470.1 unnamed protein product [Rotaria sp. Silwood2]CAF3169124.1 unnamed protein product [Rotaria sp. Silwood2]CAF3176495.1 unnamed protein product [Rotaria sp. Silwood2]CAF4058902.1 unnamed protein product [Rotaria sp. Silwood2]